MTLHLLCRCSGPAVLTDYAEWWEWTGEDGWNRWSGSTESMGCDDCGEFDCDSGDEAAEGITEDTPRTRHWGRRRVRDERTERSGMSVERDSPHGHCPVGGRSHGAGRHRPGACPVAVDAGDAHVAHV